MRQVFVNVGAILSLSLRGTFAFGDAVSKGPDGINVPTIGLDGSGIAIGQWEANRPGDPTAPNATPFDTTASLINSSVDPAQIFWRTPHTPPMPTTFDPTANANAEVGNGHAIEVAGIMISTNSTLIGVSPAAHLYSIGDNGVGPDFDPQSAEALQFLITLPGTDIRAVNMSNLNPPLAQNPTFNGDELLSQFVDWSASANGKDILYVVSGTEGQFAPNVIPSDNFNGMTIAYSIQNGAKWSKVGPNNNFSKDADGDRTSISLLAPGFGYQVPEGNSTSSAITGTGFTSYGAPQVTGAVALLQQFAVNHGSAAQWSVDARRHQVMKAVLMNSADKLIDDHSVMVNGSFVPQGGLLGMTRTVTDQNGQNWLQSEA